ncbi:MAG: hypothetical protein K9N06_02575 [Candidatus Cloacimonetes bacterium]|nr:hypothetical protein [Candidatus Cloacimonadota bacterium]
MKQIIIAISLLLIMGCSFRNTAESENLPIISSFDFSGVQSEDYYQQQLIVDMENLLEYSIKPHTFSGELPVSGEYDQDGWYIKKGSRWLTEKDILFEFSLTSGKLTDAIQFLDIEYRTPDQQEENLQICDRRLVGTLILAPVEGLSVGNCYRFKVTETISNFFTDGFYADHFMYRLNVTDLDGILQSTGEWYNSLAQTDIRALELSTVSTPALLPLSENELYQLEVYVVTRSGFADSDNPASLSFACQDEFNHPETIIYNGIEPGTDMNVIWDYNRCWLLGEHHYDLERHGALKNINYDLPQKTVAGETHYAAPFDINFEGDYTALESPDLQFYLEWGYWGQYGEPGFHGWPPEITNNPFDKEIGLLTNPDGTTQYSAEIEWYEMQLDGQAVQTDYYGSAAEELTPGWLRIRALHPHCRQIMLENLEPGWHTFSVRAADNFGNIDPEPAVFQFRIYDYIEPEDRQALLIIDADRDNLMSPDDTIDDIYLDALSGYPYAVSVIDLEDQSIISAEYRTYNSNMHFERALIAHSDLIDYKWIILHVDSASGSYFHRSLCDNLYDIHTQKSNLILSAGANLAYLCSNCLYNDSGKLEKVLEDYWRIDVSSSEQYVECISSSTLTNPFLIGAIPASGMETHLDLQLPGWNSLVTSRAGLGPCCRFLEEGITSDIIYRYDCKPVDCEFYPPTEEQYAEFHESPIAIHHNFRDSQAFVFGFNLSFMEIADLQAMFNEIFIEGE